VPWQQRAANMAALVLGLGECMATRYTVFGENLWRVAVAAFNAVVETGLPAVNISYVNDDQPPGPEVWTALAHTFEWSPPPPNTPPPSHIHSTPSHHHPSTSCPLEGALPI